MAPHTPQIDPSIGPGLDRSSDVSSEPGANGGDVPVIIAARKRVPERALAGRERDCLVLTAEERRWGRRRVRTLAGRELVLALPTGSLLVPGAVLHLDTDWYVVVEAAEEPVIAVTLSSRDEAIRVAFEVGNRHFTLAIDGERLLVPDDTAMKVLLTRLGVSWTPTRAVFAPLGAGHRH
jgi:urease accessory protein